MTLDALVELSLKQCLTFRMKYQRDTTHNKR